MNSKRHKSITLTWCTAIVVYYTTVTSTSRCCFTTERAVMISLIRGKNERHVIREVLSEDAKIIAIKSLFSREKRDKTLLEPFLCDCNTSVFIFIPVAEFWQHVHSTRIIHNYTQYAQNRLQIPLSDPHRTLKVDHHFKMMTTTMAWLALFGKSAQNWAFRAHLGLIFRAHVHHLGAWQVGLYQCARHPKPRFAWRSSAFWIMAQSIHKS